jgi:hypothetical protein
MMWPASARQVPSCISAVTPGIVVAPLMPGYGKEMSAIVWSGEIGLVCGILLGLVDNANQTFPTLKWHHCGSIFRFLWHQDGRTMVSHLNGRCGSWNGQMVDMCIQIGSVRRKRCWPGLGRARRRKGGNQCRCFALPHIV